MPSLQQLSLAALLTVASASPLLPKRQNKPCNPNFESVAVSVTHNDVEWGVWGSGVKGSQILDMKFSDAGDFVWEQTGAYPSSYIAKFRGNGDHNLVAAVAADGSLMLKEPAQNDLTQNWIVECRYGCRLPSTISKEFGGLAGDGCTIKSAATGKCVTTSTAPNQAMYVWGCDNSYSQYFNYFVGGSSSGKTDAPTNAPTLNPTSPVTSVVGGVTVTASTGAAAPTSSICNPDFEKTPVSFANSATEWEISNLAAGSALVAGAFDGPNEWTVEKTGSFYIIKATNDTKLAVSAKANAAATLETANPSDNAQQFQIECTFGCTPGSKVTGGFVGDGCKITLAADSTQCIQMGEKETAGSSGDAVSARPCNGKDSQRYNFPSSANGGAGSGASSSTTGTTGGVLSGAIGDDDESLGDLKSLIRNSYIAIGLLGAVMLAMIVLIVASCMGKGCCKGRPSTKYSKISVPSGSKGEMKSLHMHADTPELRYND